MEPIDVALRDLTLSDTKNISAIAALHGVQRSTLSRRFRQVTTSAQVKHQKQQFLQPQQELDLVQYINELTEKGIPPTTLMVWNFAKEIAGKEPRIN